MFTTLLLLLAAPVVGAGDLKTRVDMDLRGEEIIVIVREVPERVVVSRVLGPAPGKAQPKTRMVVITMKSGDRVAFSYQDKDLTIEGVRVKGIVYDRGLTDDGGTEYLLVEGEPFC